MKETQYIKIGCGKKVHIIKTTTKYSSDIWFYCYCGLFGLEEPELFEQRITRHDSDAICKTCQRLKDKSNPLETEAREE